MKAETNFTSSIKSILEAGGKKKYLRPDKYKL